MEKITTATILMNGSKAAIADIDDWLLADGSIGSLCFPVSRSSWISASCPKCPATDEYEGRVHSIESAFAIGS